MNKLIKKISVLSLSLVALGVTFASAQPSPYSQLNVKSTVIKGQNYASGSMDSRNGSYIPVSSEVRGGGLVLDSKITYSSGYVSSYGSGAYEPSAFSVKNGYQFEGSWGYTSKTETIR